ncbi:MAG: adenylate/guanylate cyclase domain-containing protein [Proteobacteria bacterium]|nr:adenylate/guanylate cyclase domain-containing protein [Pseudomonadota bacterium]
MEKKAAQIVGWLLEEAAHLPDMGVLVDRLAERLLAAGIPVSRIATIFETLHPRFVGAMRVWEPGGSTQLRRATFDDPRITGQHKVYTIDVVQETGEAFDMCLDDPEVDKYDLLPDLRDAGHTHYLLLPLKFRDEPLHGISLATRRPGGFAAGHVALLHAIRPALAAVMNIQGVHRMWTEILKAYVGGEPAELILKGAIRRGDVRRIRAALFLSDLRGFTVLANAGSPEATVAAINAYLDRVVPAIVGQGGEILKFIGDGVLAIFPITETRDAKAACAAALAAARATLAAGTGSNGRVGMALHVGEAAYGNIGAGDRLDFTIIGRDVNLLARIEKLCGLLDRPIVMSADFAAQIEAPTRALGEFELKGFAGKFGVYAPSP